MVCLIPGIVLNVKAADSIYTYCFVCMQQRNYEILGYTKVDSTKHRIHIKCSVCGRKNSIVYGDLSDHTGGTETPTCTTGKTCEKCGAEYGILPFILTSVYGTAGAMVIGVPIGLMTAIFLSKLAPAPVAAVIRTAVQLLAGIPSVVYGLVGMIVLVPLIRTTFSLGSGACLLAAILVLSIMVLPSIINVSETALRAVPREYEEASLALGATAAETYFRVSLHAARSGVATAVVLGVGRAIGEAMAIIMVAGNVANMPGLFRSVRFLTTGIISGMSYAPVGSLYQQALFSIGLVLFLFIMLINVFLNVFIKKRKED